MVFAVTGLLASGRAPESPWWWLVIPVLAGAWYLWDRSRSRSGRPMKVYWVFADLPWQLQAAVWAMLGGGSLFNLATGRVGGYWWLLPAVAWLMFAMVVVRRKPQ